MASARSTNKIKNSSWSFNEDVALRFQQEAVQHIPDYYRVIDLCIKVADQFLSKKSRILEVGSARGQTLKRLSKSGYLNITGVESSPAMVKGCYHSDKVILSDKIPIGHWEMILMNWTLHFINEKEDYLHSIYNALLPNGILIITDKMTQSAETEILYNKFKKDNGVSLAAIKKKKKMLQGILTTRSLDWYLLILHSLNFKEISIINARFGFVTMIAKK